MMCGRYAGWVLGVGLCVLGSCAAERRDPGLAGPAEYYPPWAFDAPFYYKPINVPTSTLPQREGDPVTYYTNEKMVHIQRPDTGGISTEEVPRIAVYYTLDEGMIWQRAGWFGRGQTHFSLQALQDGGIGIRFVGLGQEPAKTLPPFPHRVYIVDTTPPAIDLSIEPRRAPGLWYLPMETITIHWSVSEANPVDKPVRVALCWNWRDKSRPFWTPIKTEQESEGSLVFVVPSEAEPEGFQISVSAADRLGNVGQTFSEVLPVSSQPLPPPRTICGKPAQDNTSHSPAPEKSGQSPPASPVPVKQEPVPGKAQACVRSDRNPARIEFASPAPPIPNEPTSDESDHWLAHPWQRLSAGTGRNDPGVWRLPSARQSPTALAMAGTPTD